MSLTVNRRWRGKFGQFLNMKGQYKIDSVRSVFGILILAGVIFYFYILAYDIFGILILVPPLNIYSIDSEYTRIYTPRRQLITLPFSDKMRKKRHDKAQYECRIIQFLVKFKYYYYYYYLKVRLSINYLSQMSQK